MATFDLAVIGGGIVGLATAYRFTRRFPGKRVVVLEKEARLAEHQTGHNSGVLHSGIYYRPGSLKALNCRAGKRALEEFCAAEGIPFEICGQANGVRCEKIGPERLRELEPHAAGIAAIHVPEAGIVDYRAVCRRLAEE